jgi:hypothetical protein
MRRGKYTDFRFPTEEILTFVVLVNAAVG